MYMALGEDEGLCREFLDLDEKDFWVAVGMVLEGKRAVDVLAGAV